MIVKGKLKFPSPYADRKTKYTNVQQTLLAIKLNAVIWMEEIADRIVIDPDVMVGKPVIKGTRIPVYLIVEFVANGMTEKEILKEYPQLRKEDIKAALLYASRCIEREVTIPL